MEKIGEDLQSEKLKSLTAIRCARAAILLSSLKNATKTLTTDVPHFQVKIGPDSEVADFQYEEKIEKLMIDLAKEKQKRKESRQLIGISLLCLFIVLFIYPIFLISL